PDEALRRQGARRGRQVQAVGDSGVARGIRLHAMGGVEPLHEEQRGSDGVRRGGDLPGGSPGQAWRLVRRVDSICPLVTFGGAETPPNPPAPYALTRLAGVLPAAVGVPPRRSARGRALL